MKLQNIIFPSVNTCTIPDMYFRSVGRADFNFFSKNIRLYKGDMLHFDTYFNSISAEKWLKYTNAQKIKLTLKLYGNIRVTLLRKEITGQTIENEYVDERLCQAEEPTEFAFEYNTNNSNGIYCFSLTGERGGGEFYGGCYCADIPDENLNKVKIAIDICTFKREKFVERNLALLNERFLNNPESVLFDALEIFISDNAGTLDTDRLSSDKIHIFRNKNTGGAGGFARGLMEISDVREEKGITHALLMDDDILIEPEAIYRTYVLLSSIKKKYRSSFIGGAMLRLDHRNIQVESGAAWEGGNIVSFKQGLDLIDCKNCLLNDIEENAQYNAWWYCALPVDIVTDDNLPMPIFIRGDDVEYGLRNMKHLILMNGICVWHEPFEKKYSSFLFYYILRNRLIDNALHNMTIQKQRFTELLKLQVMEQVRLYRYKNANLLMDGVEDFLKGVDWLAEQDGEQLHKEVMSRGYKLQSLEDLEEPVRFIYTLYEDSVNAVNPVTFKYRLLRKCTVNGIFFLPTSSTRHFNIIPVEGPKDINVYRTDKVLNYDYSGRKGFLTYKDPNEAKKTIKRLKKLCKTLDMQYSKAAKDYAVNGSKLMSREFWNKYLNINNEE